MKPIIGIGPVKRHVIGRTARLIGCYEAYSDALEAAGATYLVLPCSEDESTLRAAYDAVAGVLLPGGSDVDPAFYGAAMHPLTVIGPRERDVSDLTYARWAMAERKPLLGICRGMQVMNVAAGGTLHQHVPDVIGSEIHQEPKDAVGDQYAYQLVHNIELEPSGRLARLFQVPELQVNSAHHQAVERVGSGLKITGRCSDGIIEVIEGEAGWCVGVEGHPEMIVRDVAPGWHALFADFVTACGAARP